MKSKLGKTDKLSAVKNDVQSVPIQGRDTNWSAHNFKVSNGTKTEVPCEQFDWDEVIPDKKKK